MFEILRKTCRVLAIGTISCLMVNSWSMAKPLELRPRNERQPFCGVENYRSMAHPVCGIESFIALRSPACGVETFKEVAHLSCPGSIEGKSYHIKKSQIPIVCEEGFRIVDDRKDGTYSKCHGGRGNISCEQFDYRSATCVRDQVLASCRQEGFGVEQYRECQHESHGVQAFKSCQREEFGIESFKECSFYLTLEQSKRFLQSHEETLEFMTESLFGARASLLAESQNESALACTIESIGFDPKYERALESIKTYYSIAFGRDFELDRFDCSTNVVAAWQPPLCEDSDQSRICRYWYSYQRAREWFEVTLRNLGYLRGDQPTQSDLETFSKAEFLRQSMQDVLMRIN
jgi:hypothetical protein